MKTRNPKPETRKKAEIRSPKAEGRSAAIPKNQGCTGAPIPDFGFRISAFFRVSDFDLRVSRVPFLFLTLPVLLVAATNAPDALSSSLLPPRGEIPPTFWEQYGAWVVLLSVLVAAAIVLVAWWLTRPNPARPVPWAVLARQELELLRREPQDGIFLSRVSQVLRRYIAAAFGLPSGESTTSEFCRALLGSGQIGSELSQEMCDFFKQCDLRKFSPPPPPLATFDAITRALSIVEKAEKRLADLQREMGASAADSDLPRSPKTGQPQGLASGA